MSVKRKSISGVIDWARGRGWEVVHTDGQTSHYKFTRPNTTTVFGAGVTSDRGGKIKDLIGKLKRAEKFSSYIPPINNKPKHNPNELIDKFEARMTANGGTETMGEPASVTPFPSTGTVPSSKMVTIEELDALITRCLKEGKANNRSDFCRKVGYVQSAYNGWQKNNGIHRALFERILKWANTGVLDLRPVINKKGDVVGTTDVKPSKKRSAIKHVAPEQLPPEDRARLDPSVSKKSVGVSFSFDDLEILMRSLLNYRKAVTRDAAMEPKVREMIGRIAAMMAD